MYVGTQVPPRSEDDYKVWAQLGVQHICGYPPGPESTWTAEHLTKYREYVESFGLILDMIPLPLGSSDIGKADYPNIMLGKDPERDREIEMICNIIRACAQAGIPAVKYNLTVVGVVSTDPMPGRGGSSARAFDYQKARSLPPTIAGRVDADTMWERIDYFLERVVPVAEENRIRIALHPHDPGVPSPDGLRGEDRVLGSVAGLKRFIELHPSPFHGLNFCQGTVSEMLEKPGEEIYDVIRYFGERKKIFNVHFRNIKGGYLNFVESFIDDGDVDMWKALQAYKEVGYPYMLMPDHTPHIAGPNADGVAFAYAYGYIKAMIESLERLPVEKPRRPQAAARKR
jgi:mannonate dehydratase